MASDRKTQRFRTIDGGDKPKSHSRKAGHETEPLLCPHCRGNVWIRVETGVRHDGRRVRAGVKQLACAHCLANGRISLLNG